MTPTWKFNPAQMLALACLGVVIGGWLKRKLSVLDRLNIPVSIAGGMVFAVTALVLRGRVVNLEADTLLRDLLMIAFMTTIGLGARFQLLREGGGQVILLLLIASLGSIFQNLLGIGLAMAMHLDPRIGILTGSVALAGGPATAVAFGGTFERLGVHGATTVAMASATFGIAVAGLIGGYIGGWLIKRHKLSPRPAKPSRSAMYPEIPSRLDPRFASPVPEAGPAAPQLLNTILVIGIAMGLGNILSSQLERLGLILPSYIGAMIAAAIIRNLDDRYRFASISQTGIDALGRAALYLFIVMALITLRLWELAHLALPMLAILVAQTAFCWLMCVTLCYRAMGRDYEAAITSAGFCGFMLGITANAVACMEELAEKYGAAPRSFLVVPIVGAFLIDFTNSLIITAMANLMK